MQIFKKYLRQNFISFINNILRKQWNAFNIFLNFDLTLYDTVIQLFAL